MEQLTLKKMREIVGWPNGEGDGIFSPGWLHKNHLTSKPTITHYAYTWESNIQIVWNNGKIAIKAQ